MNYFLIFILPLLIYTLSNFLISKSYLLNYSGDKHQNFTLEKRFHYVVEYFYYYILFFFHGNLLFNIFAILIFLLGIFSDLKIFNSAKFRFFTNNYFVSIHFFS